MNNSNHEKMGNLFAFYKNLLTDKQKMVMNYYFYEDYSLSEISELLNISRSAVFDQIKRCEVLLEDYENKLKLFSNFQKRCIIYERIKKYNIPEIIELIEECYKTE